MYVENDIKDPKGLILVFTIYTMFVCTWVGKKRRKIEKEEEGEKEKKMFLEENIFLHVWFAEEKERKINDLTFMPLSK